MSEIELVVVFKKEISVKKADAILNKEKLPHHEGSDSSRGKIYFYKTGPKFIINIPKRYEKAVVRKLEGKKEIYEVYHANWNICKD